MTYDNQAGNVKTIESSPSYKADTENQNEFKKVNAVTVVHLISVC